MNAIFLTILFLILSCGNPPTKKSAENSEVFRLAPCTPKYDVIVQKEYAHLTERYRDSIAKIVTTFPPALLYQFCKVKEITIEETSVIGGLNGGRASGIAINVNILKEAWDMAYVQELRAKLLLGFDEAAQVRSVVNYEIKSDLGGPDALLAYTLAHEIGHTFPGMYDRNIASCDAANSWEDFDTPRPGENIWKGRAPISAKELEDVYEALFSGKFPTHYGATNMDEERAEWVATIYFFEYLNSHERAQFSDRTFDFRERFYSEKTRTKRQCIAELIGI